MKKLILALVMITGVTSVSMAQTTKPAAAKPAAAATTAKPAAAATTAKPAATSTAAKTTANGVVLKKDGTPDKRYKNAPAASGPLKKDGTPDMRYKKNKKS